MGEQYVDLRPRTDSGPYLHNGSVIATARHHDSASGRDRCSTRSARWSKSLPKNKLGQLLDESFKAFNGAGYDLGRSVIRRRESPRTSTALPTTPAISPKTRRQCWTRRRKRTDAIRTGRAVWRASPAAGERRLPGPDGAARPAPAPSTRVPAAQQVKPTLPVLLANLTSLGQIGSPTTRRSNSCWCCSRRLALPRAAGGHQLRPVSAKVTSR